MRRDAPYVLLLGFWAISIHVRGQQEGDAVERKGMEWHARAQFAGYQGLMSLGGGPVLAKGVWRPALMYGFAPPDAGRTAVHQVVLRNDVVFFPGRRDKPTWVSPAASLNLLLETGRHSYLKLPERFPRGYYMAPLPRITFGLGGRVTKDISGSGPFREVAFTAEAVGMDVYLWYAASERGIPIHDAFGLGFGVGLTW